MNNVFSKLNISRINYWKYVLASMTILLIVFGSIILPAVLGLEPTLLSALYPLAIVVPFYNLVIIIGRLRNIGGRSFILWFLGFLTPFLGAVLFIRLGLIKADDESDFSLKQRLFVAFAASANVIFYFMLIVARYVIDYGNSQAG
ncbi:hypothetical protein OAX71_02890 [Pseudomonadales bacterium]|nr:hypothetical protein [Pseudomonadales bacterium]